MLVVTVRGVDKERQLGFKFRVYLRHREQYPKKPPHRHCLVHKKLKMDSSLIIVKGIELFLMEWRVHVHGTGGSYVGPHLGMISRSDQSSQ